MAPDSLIRGYRLVFEPQLIVESYPAALWIAVPVLLGVAVLVQRRSRAYALAAATLVAVGMLYLRSVSASVNRVMARRFATLQRAARDSATPMVEGPIQAFRAAVVEGHQAESFTVAGVPFAYSDYAASGAFNQTGSHGGPIRAGLRVRIRYVPLLGGNAIVRLEVADTAGVLPD
jgi:hypothetical protein